MKAKGSPERSSSALILHRSVNLSADPVQEFENKIVFLVVRLKLR